MPEKMRRAQPRAVDREAGLSPARRKPAQKKPPPERLAPDGGLRLTTATEALAAATERNRQLHAIGSEAAMLGACARLVRAVPCWQAHIGTDPASIVAELRRALERG